MTVGDPPCTPFPGCTSQIAAELPIAINYLTMSAYGNKLLNIVLSGPPIEIVQQNNGAPGDATSLPGGGLGTIIYWDPHGLLTERHWDARFGRPGHISPAVALAHEIVHAENPQITAADDERGAISGGYERFIALNLRAIGFGESPRQPNAPGATNPSSYGDFNASSLITVSHSDMTDP